MKRILQAYGVMALLLLFSHMLHAQALSGESDPFIFDTREPLAVIPLSGLSVMAAMLLLTAFIVWRHVKSKNANTEKI